MEQIFDIDADTGAIVTGKGLDRETAGWHNITVLAMEAGELGPVGGGAQWAAAGAERRLSCQSRHMGEESRVGADTE